MRTVYAGALLLLICTAWLIVKETQIIQNVGDMARFGAILFQILAPLQLALILFLSAISAASNIAIEKDRQTLILLLMSRLTNSELVLGKLFASLLNIGVMLLTSLPIFMLIVLFGGTSFEQVGWTFAVTFATAFAAGSLGALMALSREKTFQTLALVGIAIVFWLGLWEGIGISGISVRGVTGQQMAAAASPLQAIIAASQRNRARYLANRSHAIFDCRRCGGVMMCAIAVWKVRKWNPNREIRPGQQDTDATDHIDLFTGELEPAALEPIPGAGSVAAEGASPVPGASPNGSSDHRTIGAISSRSCG